jgi:peptidoglycan/xylan/chitin deacetylase (PgdA/CDA1 family)
MIPRPPPAIIGALAAVRRHVVFDVSVAQRGVALTFDDGPDERVTPRLLDVLAAHEARATFFAIGERAQAAPATLRKISASGHELGNHLWEDRRSAARPPAESSATSHAPRPSSAARD